MMKYIFAIATVLMLFGTVDAQYRGRQVFNQYNQYNQYNRFRFVTPTYVYPLPASYYYNQSIYNSLQWQLWQQQYWQMQNYMYPYQYNGYGYGYSGVPQILIPPTIR